jgi:hypothetical protein
VAKNISDTELVFIDLKDIAVELQNECNSPIRVRRLLSRFITMSQQLTEVMRKECSDQIGKEWRANNFSGWNEVTALFKKLRRTDYHSYPVTICVEETQYFAVGDIFEDGVGTSEVAVQGTWELGDPFSEHIPDGLKLVLADHTTGRPSNKTIEPRRRHYVFKLNVRTQELEQALQKIGTKYLSTLQSTTTFTD